MKAGIITTPNRQSYLPDLVKLIAPKVDSLKIFNDLELQGHKFNLERMMTEMLDGAGKDEPILLMCDDVTTIPDWKERWEEIHSRAGQEIYIMMNRKRHLFTEENLKRGYVIGVFPGAFYDHAVIYINQQGFIKKMNDWWEDRGKSIINPKLAIHYDNIIQEYLVDSRKKFAVTTPTLFNHIGDTKGKSVLKHQIGQSFNYIGNELRNTSNY